MLVASSPLCGFNFFIVDTPALPFCHTKGVKAQLAKLIAHWVERVKEPTFMLLLHNSNKVFAGAPE